MSGMQVQKVLDSGVVVALPGGRDCFVHVSEVASPPPRNPADVVKVGQLVDVVIQSVSPRSTGASIAALQGGQARPSSSGSGGAPPRKLGRLDPPSSATASTRSPASFSAAASRSSSATSAGSVRSTNGAGTHKKPGLQQRADGRVAGKLPTRSAPRKQSGRAADAPAARRSSSSAGSAASSRASSEPSASRAEGRPATDESQ